MRSTRSGGVMDVLAAAVQAVAGQDLAGVPDAVVRDRLLDLDELVGVLRAQVLRSIELFDGRGLGVGDGCRTTVGWLRSFTRVSVSTAAEQVRGARVLRDLPGLAAATLDGRLGVEQVRQVGRLVQRVGVEPVARVERVLVEAGQVLDGSDFGRVCDRVRAHVDPDGELDAAGADFARRRLTLSRSDGVVLVRGQLDVEGGAAVIGAVEALMSPPRCGDERDAGQRRADALVELARGALVAGRLPARGGIRPQLGVLVTPAQLMAPVRRACPAEEADVPPRVAAAGPVTLGAESAGAGGGLAALLSDGAAPWLDRVGDVPVPVVQRIACDADVWRVVLDPATGRPVDVGRRHRLVPRWIRRALIARDRECRFPGCRAPSAWTDAHHLTPWADGGATDIENLILLCRFHHVLVHEGRWRIRLDHHTGHVTVTRPNGTPYEIHDHRTGPAPGPPT